MNKKIILAIAAGAFALAPSPASAYTGVLIKCGPGGSANVVTASLKKGLTCTAAINKIKVDATGKTGNQLDSCVANAGAPWDAWVAGKWSKLTSTDAALIDKADVDIKASTFGTCNFVGGATSSKAWGKGKVTFYAADGITKVKQGKVQFIGRVAGDLTTTSAQTIGIVTKGPGVGGSVVVQVALDIVPLLTSPLLGCNTDPTFCGDNSACTGPGTPGLCCTGVGTGTCIDPFGDKHNAACTGVDMPSVGCTGTGRGGLKCRDAGDPYPCCTGPGTGDCYAPVAELPLVTGGTGYLQISYDSNDDCTAASTPYLCCTGAGTGTCN
jgi:hypothetical protein